MFELSGIPEVPVTWFIVFVGLEFYTKEDMRELCAVFYLSPPTSSVVAMA
jgi:hypothetical protein